MSSSQPIIKHLRKAFKDRFKITTENEKENELSFDGAFYKPDLLFHNKRNGKIEAIIEVEQGARKHMVGGVITADYCIGKRNLNKKPMMYVLALDEKDKIDYRKRLKLFKKYVRSIKIPFIGNKNEIIKQIEEKFCKIH